MLLTIFQIYLLLYQINNYNNHTDLLFQENHQENHSQDMLMRD